MASAGKGVSQVMNRCEMAKATGYLDLSDCGLLYVTDAIYFVLKEYQIAKCNLKNNGMKNFPKKMVERLPHIMLLNLENNKLTSIPDEIANWSQMRALNLSHNKLTSFPEVLFKLEMLQFLDIGNNEIE
uniref:Uncharacterized protein n=1 Tax=Plectus sambesii TaxID=2011161 RepID=A0A914WJX4_9BILA